MGFPDPLKTLPSISTLIGIFKTSPVNSQVVLRLSMPEVPSKIYKTNELEEEGRRNSLNTYLDDGLLSLDLKDLSLTNCTISESNINDFGIFGEFDIIQDHEGSFDVQDCPVINSWRDIVVGSDCFELSV